MSLKNSLKAVLCVLFWGLTYPLSKYLIIKGFNPVFLVALRFSLGGGVLFFFVKRPEKEILKLFVLSFTLHSIPVSLTAISVKYVDAALASLTTQLDVPFAWVLSVVFLKEKISFMQGLGLIISFLGMYFVADSPEFSGHTISLIALVVASFMYGVASIQIKKMTLSAVTITAWSYIISAPFTLSASFLFEGPNSFISIQNTFGVWISFLLLTFFSLLAFYMWSQRLQEAEVNKVVPFTILVPVSSLAFSYLLLGEVTHSQALWGGLLTMCGVVLQVFSFDKKENA